MTESVPPMLKDLLFALRAHPRFAAAGLSAEQLDRGIVIKRGDEVCAIWHAAGSALDWTPAGHGGPTHRVLSADDALTHSLAALLRQRA